MPPRRMIPLWTFIALGACNVDPTVGPPEKVNGKNAPEVVLDHRGLGVPVDTLVSTVVSASDSFGALGSVAVVGDYVVAGESYAAPYLHIVSRTSGALLTSAGRQGEGPGEFNLAPHFLPSAFGDSTLLWLAPPLQRHAAAIDIRAIVEKRPEWLQSTVRVDETRFRPNGVWLSPNEWLVRGYTSSGNGPLLVFDSLGLLRDSFPEPPVTDNRLRASSLSGAYFYSMCGSPNGQHAAMGFAHTGRVALLSRESGGIIEAEVPYRFRPHLPLLGKILMDFKGGTAGARRAYSDCVATDSLVYAGFRGTLRGKVSQAPPPANTFLHVFDWSGKLLRVHHLDHTITGMDLDRVNHVLYTVSNHPDSVGPSVRRTVLPR